MFCCHYIYVVTKYKLTKLYCVFIYVCVCIYIYIYIYIYHLYIYIYTHYCFVCYVKNIIYLFTLQVDIRRNVSCLLSEKVLIV